MSSKLARNRSWRVVAWMVLATAVVGCSRQAPAAKESEKQVVAAPRATTRPTVPARKPAPPVVIPKPDPIPEPPAPVPETPPEAPPVEPPARPTGPARVGLNLAAVQDWSREWAFVDAYKGAREWVPVGGSKTLALEKGGNPLPAPGQSAWTLLLRDLGGHYPAGKYTVSWKGSGDVEVKRWDVAKVIEKSNGRAVIEVKPSDGGIQIDLKSSDPKNPVRDFRVIMPGFEKAKSPFHPLFVKRLGPARVVRFMDWQRTNNSPLAKWADRPKPTDPTYATDRGVPVEVMVELANTAKVDPWFCMPHQADDDFVRQFARMVKASLATDRTVYVEYSNEVWNFQFGQTKWAREQGKALNLGAPEHIRFYAQRAAEVMAIWEAEFGRDRLVRVLASQAAVPDLTAQILSWKDTGKHADALAVAPYFGYEYGDRDKADASSKMTAEQLLEGMAKEIDGPNRDFIRKQAELARKAGLRLVAYEGGQHLVGVAGGENNAALTKVFHAANRHPRMYDLHTRHLKHWADAGGDVYVLFNYVTAPSKWGSWGLLEYQDQPVAEAHKYRAFLDAGAGAARPAP